MPEKRPWRPGDFYRIDDRTGFKTLASRTKKEWTGLIVDRDVYEARHPQEFVRGRADKQSVPDPRPRPQDQFQMPRGGPFILVFRDDEYGARFNIEQADETMINIVGGVEEMAREDF